MPHLKHSAQRVPLCEGDVPFQQEFVETATLTRRETFRAVPLRFVGESCPATRHPAARHPLALLVLDSCESIRQPKQRRPQPRRDPLRHPLRKKEDPRLAPVPHIGAHIQKLVVPEPAPHPVRHSPSECKSQSLLRKRHHAHIRFPIAHIQAKRHLRLQSRRLHFIMYEQHTHPRTLEEPKHHAPHAAIPYATAIPPYIISKKMCTAVRRLLRRQ